MMKQQSFKHIIKIPALFILFYCGLVCLFKMGGLAEVYGNSFRSLGSSFYEGNWGDKKITLKKHKRKKTDPPGVNTMLLVRKKGQKSIKGSLLDTWIFACLPNVVLLSLLLITPVNWKQKGKIFLKAFLVLNLILLLKLGLNILGVIGEAQWFQTSFFNSISAFFLPFIKLIEQHSIFAMLLGFITWLYFSFDYLLYAFKESFQELKLKHA